MAVASRTYYVIVLADGSLWAPGYVEGVVLWPYEHGVQRLQHLEARARKGATLRRVELCFPTEIDVCGHCADCVATAAPPHFTSRAGTCGRTGSPVVLDQLPPLDCPRRGEGGKA